MKEKELHVVGWYHSHPVSEAKPSQSDILSQRKYQEAVRLKESSTEPCIGVIVSECDNPTTVEHLIKLIALDPYGIAHELH